MAKGIHVAPAHLHAFDVDELAFGMDGLVCGVQIFAPMKRFIICAVRF
jgi:hypothetical protein